MPYKLRSATATAKKKAGASAKVSSKAKGKPASAKIKLQKLKERNQESRFVLESITFTRYPPPCIDLDTPSFVHPILV